MKVYHYITISDWREAQRSAKRQGTAPALAPRMPMGREEQRAKWQRGFYALFEPTPDSWQQNKEFPEVWTELETHLGSRMLVEVDINENDPNAFVVDWGHKEAYLQPDDAEKPSKTRENAEAAYYESRIPLKDYLARKNVLHYSLPEVLITDDVPFDRIRVSEVQPLLEKELRDLESSPETATALHDIARELRREIQTVPELQEWYKKFQSETKNEAKREINEGKRL